MMRTAFKKTIFLIILLIQLVDSSFVLAKKEEHGSGQRALLKSKKVTPSQQALAEEKAASLIALKDECKAVLTPSGTNAPLEELVSSTQNNTPNDELEIQERLATIIANRTQTIDGVISLVPTTNPSEDPVKLTRALNQLFFPQIAAPSVSVLVLRLSQIRDAWIKAAISAEETLQKKIDGLNLKSREGMDPVTKLFDYSRLVRQLQESNLTIPIVEGTTADDPNHYLAQPNSVQYLMTEHTVPSVSGDNQIPLNLPVRPVLTRFQDLGLQIRAQIVFESLSLDASFTRQAIFHLLAAKPNGKLETVLMKLLTANKAYFTGLGVKIFESLESKDLEVLVSNFLRSALPKGKEFETPSQFYFKLKDSTAAAEFLYLESKTRANDSSQLELAAATQIKSGEISPSLKSNLIKMLHQNEDVSKLDTASRSLLTECFVEFVELTARQVTKLYSTDVFQNWVIAFRKNHTAPPPLVNGKSLSRNAEHRELTDVESLILPFTRSVTPSNLDSSVFAGFGSPEKMLAMQLMDPVFSPPTGKRGAVDDKGDQKFFSSIGDSIFRAAESRSNDLVHIPASTQEATSLLQEEIHDLLISRMNATSRIASLFEFLKRVITNAAEQIHRAATSQHSLKEAEIMSVRDSLTQIVAEQELKRIGGEADFNKLIDGLVTFARVNYISLLQKEIPLPDGNHFFSNGRFNLQASVYTALAEPFSQAELRKIPNFNLQQDGTIAAYFVEYRASVIYDPKTASFSVKPDSSSMPAVGPVVALMPGQGSAFRSHAGSFLTLGLLLSKYGLQWTAINTANRSPVGLPLKSLTEIIAHHKLLLEKVKSEHDPKLPFRCLGRSMGAAEAFTIALLYPGLCDALELHSFSLPVGLVSQHLAIEKQLPERPDMDSKSLKQAEDYSWELNLLIRELSKQDPEYFKHVGLTMLVFQGINDEDGIVALGADGKPVRLVQRHVERFLNKFAPLAHLVKIGSSSDPVPTKEERTARTAPGTHHLISNAPELASQTFIIMAHQQAQQDFLLNSPHTPAPIRERLQYLFDKLGLQKGDTFLDRFANEHNLLAGRPNTINTLLLEETSREAQNTPRSEWTKDQLSAEQTLLSKKGLEEVRRAWKAHNEKINNTLGNEK